MDTFVQAHEAAIRLGFFLGIHCCRDPREVSRLPGLPALPFRGRITGYAINRRQWLVGEGVDE